MKYIATFFLFLGIIILAGCLETPDPTPMPPTNTPRPSPTPTPRPGTVAGFQQFLTELESAQLDDRSYLVNVFLANLDQVPLTEGSEAIFLWNGTGIDVRLTGDMTNWHEENAIPLRRIEGTTFWYLSAEYDPAARLDYKFIVDGNEFLDELNERTIQSGFGLRSELVMPGYEFSAELVDPNDYPQGELHEHTIDSEFMLTGRTFIVYTPPGELIGAQYPSLYIHDGGDYLSLINSRRLLDTMIGSRQIPPIVAVFVPPLDRYAEYDRSVSYTNFMSEELVPFVQENYNVDPSPAKTGTMGASMGGLISVHLGLERSDVFGLIAAKSGAYSLGSGAIIGELEARNKADLKLHISVGTFDTEIVRNETGNLLAANRRLVAILEQKGYEFTYVEWPEGHSWGLWEAQFGEALRYLYR